MVRETWTDERLDDLANRVDEGFRESRADLRQFRQEVRSDIGSLRTGMDRRFSEAKAEVDARLDKVDARFDRIDARFESLDAKFDAKFDSLQRMMIGGLITLVVTMVLTRV
ncbi:MAG TPA: hypothetical protein VFX45_04410 [Solirubrobacterales bacterium]|nr:hypothetical protein [Solirubrobacterales bacterium]